MKKYLLILLACIPGLVSDAYGQIVALTVPESDKVTLGNVQVSKDSDNIYVDYDILFGSRILSCLVGLEVSLNAGKSFEPVTDGLSGDIHRVESSGHKRIALPLNIYAKKFADESIIFNVFVSDVVLAPSVHEFDYSSALNLSTGGTANCYIVSRGGVYSILPVKGNSSVSVGSVAYAEVLWESFGTSETPKIGDLIEAALYSDGQIYFKVPSAFREGNAVIAAKDASGTILWSWHIWLTDQPKEQVYYNNAGTMMDRNLGATSAAPGDVVARGLLYQWGRKDPFLGSSSISTKMIEARSTVKWPAAVETSSETGTVNYATENPMVYLTGSKSNKWDWHYSSRNNNLWHSSKTIYDPCPSGWRVPDGGEYGVWVKASRDEQVKCSYDRRNIGINFVGKFGDDSIIWYPICGSRSCSDEGELVQGYYGNYWSVSLYSDSVYSLYFNNPGFVFMLSRGDSRASGQSVRCIKE